MPRKNNENLIWIDLEMTGLDTNGDDIIEIATIITNKELEILSEGPVMAINQPDSILLGMDEWNTEQHGRSGLIDRVRNSSVTMRQAEQATLGFIQEWVDRRYSPMCGNSICQDRRFMARQMPELEDYFSYRHIDVSTIKELTKRWAPAIAKNHVKSSQHLALQDIRDSIDELKYYREHVFTI